MHETLLATVFCDAMKAHPACAPLANALQWQTTDSKTVTTPPAVVFSARDVVPVGYKLYCTGTVEVKLESSMDDETNNETHIARSNLLLAAINDTGDTNLRDAINGANHRRLVHRGCVLIGGGRGVDGRKWTASMLLRVLFAPVS